MASALFDRPQLARRRARALAHPKPGADFLIELAASDLADRLAAVARRFPRALVYGDPTDRLRAAIAAGGQVDAIFEADVLAATPGRTRLLVDEAALPFDDGSFDLVVSCLSLQWIDDLPAALAGLRRILKPDGLLLATLVGGDSLVELRRSLIAAESELFGGAGPRVMPMVEIRDLGTLMQQAGFALPVVDQDRLTLRYDSALALMGDLAAMGATNALAERRRTMTPRGLFMRAAEIYARDFADADGRIRATMTLLSVSGWAPGPGQPKPARPGSATVRLADALRAIETEADDAESRDENR